MMTCPAVMDVFEESWVEDLNLHVYICRFIAAQRKQRLNVRLIVFYCSGSKECFNAENINL